MSASKLTGGQDTHVFGALVHAGAMGPAGPMEWNSRWHRKRRQRVPDGDRTISWWLALLFTAGSVLFVFGGVAAIMSADRAAAWLNLVGSLGFSVGAFLAVLEAADAAKRLGRRPGLGGLWGTAAGRASLIQIVAAAGFFQIAMVAGMFPDLGWVRTDLWVWTPSTIGSVGFVVSSLISFREARPAADVGATAAGANLVGSACFLAGSLDGYLAQGPTGLPGVDVADPVFVIGSVLFLIGSVLGFAELRRPLGLQQTASPFPASLSADE